MARPIAQSNHRDDEQPRQRPRTLTRAKPPSQPPTAEAECPCCSVAAPTRLVKRVGIECRRCTHVIWSRENESNEPTESELRAAAERLGYDLVRR